MRPFIRACARRPCLPCTVRSIKPRPLPLQPQRYRSHNTSPTSGPDPPPFHGYLLDALDAPLHSISPLTSTSLASPPPESPPESPEEAKLAKARVVFGSRLAGPAERKREIERASTMVAGVMVPPKPEEPDNCCMSGCVNCVWDLFRDELEEWAAKSKEAREREGKMSRGQVAVAEGGIGDEDAGWSGAGEEEGGRDLFEGIPVGIREFMRTEKKLKERHRREGRMAG